jgi:hypothetical protein
MARTVITPRQCGDMLFEWLRSYCNSSSARSVARDVDYKYSFFSPAKKMHLFEELTFLYVSLAVHGVNTALDDNLTVEAVVDAFLAKMRKTLLESMASGDERFQERYAARVGSYFELLRGGGDAIGVAGDFLVGLFGTPDARLRLTVLKIATAVTVAQVSLQKVFQQIEVSNADAL